VTPQLLRLRPGDDILIAARPISAGEPLELDGPAASRPAGAADAAGAAEAAVVIAQQDIATGFKVAARDLAVGDIVHRLGMPIGRVTAATGRGEVVHLHNLESQYLRTHRRGEA
jgi:altronate hydrolase